MKALIRKDQVNGYWKARFNNRHEWFHTFDAAALWAKKEMKRFYKESTAFTIVGAITTTQLACRELELVEKLVRTKCKGITKAQYGWLRGIHERQTREW